MEPSAICADRVAIYIRWSTDDQGEGTTLETQLERCRHYLSSQGWNYREDLVYIDDGYSGGTLERPALSRLRADVKAGRVECVVVYRIDRLSRSVADIVDLVLREWEGRCFVKSTTEEVNTITPAGKMFFYILVSFAEYERGVIKERTMNGKIKRAEQGMNPGFRPPFGYTRGALPGALEIVDHEAPIVRRIFTLFLQGNGAAEIARRLNEEGLKRRGRAWSPLGVRRLLANPAYAGVLEYGRSEDGRPYARVEGAFPTIVDMHHWHEAQQLLAGRSAARTPARKSDGYLLSGLASCRCGARVTGKSAGRHRYYCCTARKHHGPGACTGAYVPAEQAEALVGEQVHRQIYGLDHSAVLEEVARGLLGSIRELRTLLTRARRETTAARERRSRLEADYRTGVLPAELYAAELEQVALEEERTARRTQALQERLEWVRALTADRAQLSAWMRSIDLWDRMSFPERQQLLRRLTREIRLWRPAAPGAAPSLQVVFQENADRLSIAGQFLSLIMEGSAGIART